MNVALLFSSICLVVGGLLLVAHFLSRRPASLAVRLARARGELPTTATAGVAGTVPEPLRVWAQRLNAGYEQALRAAGRGETVRLFVRKKLLLTVAVPLVPLLPYSAAVRHLPSLLLIVVLGVCGFFLPDVVVRGQARERRQALLLDLPEALAVMALSLRAGQSLRQALELAARDSPGPLGQELTRALSLARRERMLGEREALVRVAHESGEPAFTRFAELLLAKESPYVEFLRSQAREMRGEQSRHLERAADRAYLAMHAPLIPLLAVLILILAYGFIHFLTQTV